MTKRLIWWFILLTFIALLVFISALFLTPSFTQKCSADLLMCLDQVYDFPWYQRLWNILGCVFHNVTCVLGGLFV